MHTTQCTVLRNEVLQRQQPEDTLVASCSQWTAWIFCIDFPHMRSATTILQLPLMAKHRHPDTPRNRSEKSKIFLIRLYFNSQENVTCSCSRCSRFPTCPRGLSYQNSLIRLLKQTKSPRTYVYKNKQLKKKHLSFVLLLLTFTLNLMPAIGRI